MLHNLFRIVALSLFLTLVASGAQPDETLFVGKTREQVVARFGKPTSSAKRAAKEILTFASCRLTLTNGVVTKGEAIEAPAPEATIDYRRPVAPPPKKVIAKTIAAARAPISSERVQASSPSKSDAVQQVSDFRRVILLSGTISVSVLGLLLAWRSFRPRGAGVSFTDALLHRSKPPAV